MNRVVTMKFYGKTSQFITTNVDSDFIITKRKDIELDSAEFMLLNINEGDITNIQAGMPVDITITENEVEVYWERWKVATINADLSDYQYIRYNIRLGLIEYTRELQDMRVIAKAFTQPNDGTVRYSLYEVMKTLVTLPNIQSRLDIRFSEKLLSRLLVTEFNGNIIVDNNSIKSPNLQFKDRTLFECLDECLDILDAVPRLVGVKDNNLEYAILDADFYNEKNNEITNFGDINFQQFNQDLVNNVDTIWTRVENPQDAKSDLIYYPGADTTISLKSDNLIFDKDESAYIPTGNTPIEQLISVKVNFYSINLKGNIQINDFGSEIFSSLSSLENTGAFPNPFYIECVGNIVEKAEYNTLLNRNDFPGILTELYYTGGIWKDNTLFYERNKPNIRGIYYISSGLILTTSIDSLYAMIISSLIKTPEFKNAWLLLHPNNPYPENFTYKKTGIQNPFSADQAIDLEWNTIYIGNKDFTFRTTKPNGFGEKFITQQARRLDIERAGFRNLGLINRMGIYDDIRLTTHNNTSEIFNISDYIDNNIITTASYEYSAMSIKASYTFNQNFNKLGSHLLAKDERRTVNIEADNVLETLTTKYIQVQISDTAVSNYSAYYISISFLKQYGFNLNDLSYQNPIVICQAQMTGQNEILNTPKENTSIANVTFIPDAKIIAVGRSILINAIPQTNTKIGDVVNTDKRIEPIPYVYLNTGNTSDIPPKYEGECEKISLAFGYNFVDIYNISSKQKPYLGSSTPTIFIPVNRLLGTSLFTINKDRQEIPKIQLEFEVLPLEEKLLIYPEFARSHQLFYKPNEQKNYKIALLKKGNMTLSINNINQMTDNIYQTSEVLNSLDWTIISNNYVRLRLEDYIQTNGRPYIIYETTSGNIMLANNSPLYYGGNTFLLMSAVEK